ncbi:MAG: class I SAM-dependent methyltransferase, partial [Kiloniellales bacterium]
ILGLRRRGFFIPYRYADRLARPGDRPPIAALEALFRAAEPAFRAHLDTIERLAAELEALDRAPLASAKPPAKPGPPAPRWRQDWFPRLDAAAAYAMVRARRPARIVEIGCGHSTRFMARAVGDGGLDTEITAIDPAPRAALADLPVRRTHRPLHQAMEEAEHCAPGDFLFIDSSHLLMPGTDVELALTRLLPALPAGALVHFHDVFLPDDYPVGWAWRGYNEQLGVAALLLGGERYRPLFASHYVMSRMAGALAQTVVARLPLVEGAVESSLWLEKR